eukprot:m.129272 g.129272  ORF g.129272 m.129272 type:complete len:112 (-) comp11255_c0_seq2:12-347(-)
MDTCPHTGGTAKGQHEENACHEPVEGGNRADEVVRQLQDGYAAHIVCTCMHIQHTHCVGTQRLCAVVAFAAPGPIVKLSACAGSVKHAKAKAPCHPLNTRDNSAPSIVREI